MYILLFLSDARTTSYDHEQMHLHLSAIGRFSDTAEEKKNKTKTLKDWFLHSGKKKYLITSMSATGYYILAIICAKVSHECMFNRFWMILILRLKINPALKNVYNELCEIINSYSKGLSGALPCESSREILLLHYQIFLSLQIFEWYLKNR